MSQWVTCEVHKAVWLCVSLVESRMQIRTLLRPQYGDSGWSLLQMGELARYWASIRGRLLALIYHTPHHSTATKASIHVFIEPTFNPST